MMINKEWQNSKGNKWRNNYYKIKEGAEDSLFVTKLGYLGAMKKKKKPLDFTKCWHERERRI